MSRQFPLTDTLQRPFSFPLSGWRRNPGTFILADLPAPAVGACTHTDTVKVNSTATLNPGVYCGGIDVGSTGVVTFNPGNYILAGGGFNVNGGATVRGQNVMFYNTTGAHKPGPIWVNGSATVDLSGTKVHKLMIVAATVQFQGDTRFAALDRRTACRRTRCARLSSIEEGQ